MADAWTYGGKSPQARTVLVYGNCQAPFVARMLASLDDLNGDYRFVFAANNFFPGETQARPVPDEDLRDVALLLQQHEDRAGNPALLALKSRLPATCPVLTFPSFAAFSLWQFECPEPRGRAEPGYPWKRYPMGDMIGLQVARSGITGELAVAAYMDLSMRKMPDLKNRLQRDIERMHHYDARCDVKLADYVEPAFRREHLFWTAGHMSATAVAELARRIAAVARPVLGGSAERADTCLAAVLDFDGMGEVQHPIHPVVADVLDLGFCQPDTTYRWYSQNWTFFDYIQRYIGYDTKW